MSFYPGDYNELRGFLAEVESGNAPPVIETTMVTIDEGENALLRFTVRDAAGAIVPLAGIASFSVTLVYQADDGTWGDILGTWTFTAPSTYTAGMQAGTGLLGFDGTTFDWSTATVTFDGIDSAGIGGAGQGIFEIEVLSSQTGTPGILSAVTTVAFVDSTFFVSGSEVLVTVTEDVLEILDVPSLVITPAPSDDLTTWDATDTMFDDSTVTFAG